MSKHNYSESEFKNAVVSSLSIRAALIKLGMNGAGGNYRVFRKFAKLYGVDYSHFLGLGASKNKKIGPKRPIEDYLSNTYPINSHNLKHRLINDGYFQHKCYDCENTHWQGTIIPIELHHKDGNHENNNLDNLEILCPNCHSIADNKVRNQVGV